MSKRSGFTILTIGLLAGAGVGSFATWKILWRPAEPHHEVRYAPREFEEDPEQMLFPRGFTWETLYPDEAMREVLVSPDAIKIHRADKSGELVIKGVNFSSEGATPDRETRDRLVRAMGSLSSYEPPGKVCSFHPDVLLVLTKGGRDYRILYCFGCRQTALLDGAGGADMSIQGAKVFLKCFCDTLKDDTYLDQMRRALEFGGS